MYSATESYAPLWTPGLLGDLGQVERNVVAAVVLAIKRLALQFPPCHLQAFGHLVNHTIGGNFQGMLLQQTSLDMRVLNAPELQPTSITAGFRERANTVHCRRLGSERSTYLVHDVQCLSVLGGVLFDALHRGKVRLFEVFGNGLVCKVMNRSQLSYVC